MSDTFDVVVSRTFPVPPDQVWRAWDESDLVKQWWGPTGFSCPVADVDLRVGGRTLVAMRAPAEFGGGDMYSTWTYTEVVPHSESRTCSTLPIRKATGWYLLILGCRPEFRMTASTWSLSMILATGARR